MNFEKVRLNPFLLKTREDQ